MRALSGVGLSYVFAALTISFFLADHRTVSTKQAVGSILPTNLCACLTSQSVA